MREPENIRAVEQLGVDWMGFILHPASSRFVAQPPSYMPTKAKRVGVTVDMDISHVVEKQQLFGFDILQLHGHESPDYCLSLRQQLPRQVKLMKAIAVADTSSLLVADRYTSIVDYFLFETPSATYGGSGRRFDWDLLDGYTSPVPFLLAGGIGPDDVSRLRSFSHPRLMGIDLNSRFESAPALKDIVKLQQFLRALRTEDPLCPSDISPFMGRRPSGWK